MVAKVEFKGLSILEMQAEDKHCTLRRIRGVFR